MSIAVPMRECRKCGLQAYTTLDLINFVNDSCSLHGKRQLCYNCQKEITKLYVEKNRETINKKKKKKSLEPKEKLKKAEYKLKTRYGITLSDYDRMLDKQDGCCAICMTTNPKSHGRFIVDHNHDTGEVRGLLCTSCNGALGKFSDSILVLKSAIKYLSERGSYGK